MRDSLFVRMVVVSLGLIASLYRIVYSAENEQPQLKAPWRGVAQVTQGNHGSTSHYDHDGVWDNTYAIDVFLPIGSDVLAPADGIIKPEWVDDDPNGAGGKELAIEHTGPTGKKFVTVYLHLDEVIIKGGNVKQGDVVARSGATGDVTGPHLHFHLWGQVGSLDSHTMPMERLLIKQVGVDSDFREYNARKGELDDVKIARHNFESNQPTRILSSILSVDLSTNLPQLSSSVSGSVVFAAAVSGTVPGTLNYTFWWNCNYIGTAVDQLSSPSVCGNPRDPAIGAKFDGVSDNPKVVNHTYSSPGTYTAKVIAENGPSAVEKRVQIAIAPSGSITIPPDIVLASYTVPIPDSTGSGSGTGNGVSSGMQVSTPCDLPTAPSNLRAIEVSQSQVDLVWEDNSTTETGFSIERRVGSGELTGLISTGQDRTQFSDLRVEAGVNYTYQIRALNECGFSTYSNEASAAPGATKKPDLTITSINIPSSAVIGESIPLSATVKNQGSDRTLVSYVGFYLSSDAAISTADQFLGECGIPELAPGESSTCNRVVVNVPNVTPGTHYLGATVDHNNLIVENNESNNTFPAPPVTITSPLPPPTITLGEIGGRITPPQGPLSNTRIAFVSNRDGNDEIYTMSYSGSDLFNLTSNSANDYYPSWSPDGKKIAFQTNRDSNNEIYMMGADGNNPIRLTNQSTDDGQPVWSPDGRQIAFQSSRDSNWEIYLMKTDGSNPINLSKNGANEQDPSWSPDGAWIAFMSNRDEYANMEIYLMKSIDGTSQIRLTTTPYSVDDRSPAWSPDRTKIAFQTNRDGNTEIYVMNADGSNPVNLTRHPANDLWPAWSPDGTKIAFASNRDGNDGNREIYMMNADGSNPIRLTNNPADDRFPSWSPFLPAIQLSDTTVDVGKVGVSSQGTKTFSITNTGGGLLSVSNITSSNSQFVASPTSFSLSAGSSQPVTVTFISTALGPQNGVLTITHDGSRNPASVTLTGMGVDATPPSAPSGLTTTPGDGQVSLTWVANQESDLSYYIIYRSLVASALGDLVGRVDKPGTTFINTGLSVGVYYYYRIKAVDTADNKSGASNQVLAILAILLKAGDPVPPLLMFKGNNPPAQTVTISDSGNTTMAVTPSITGADAGQFRVSPSGITTVAPGTTQLFSVIFAPSPATGNNRSATLTLTHNATNRSGPLSVALIGEVPPNIPSGLSATPGNNQAILNWVANTEPDISSYIIYRSTINNFAPAPMDSIAQVNKPATTYTNTGLNAGTYYFKIAAVDSTGNKSSTSTQASVTVVPVDSVSSLPTAEEGTWIITTFAGTGTMGFSGDGGPATEAMLNRPNNVSADSEGSIYVVDWGNNRIRIVRPDGTITTFAGSDIAGFSGDGGPASIASLKEPNDVTVDTKRNVYIADTGNWRIRRVGPDGVITTFAGTGVGDYSLDEGLAIQSKLTYPVGVSVDTKAGVYIAEVHSIRRIGADGIIRLIAGTGHYGFSGDGNLASQADLRNPSSVAVDANGVVYIADPGNNRIRRVGLDGIITTVAGSGPADPSIGSFSGDGGPATQATLNGPMSVALDSKGNIYIADYYNHRIRLVDRSGIITTFAGSGRWGFSGDGGPATQAELDSPNGVAVDTKGNMYIADEGNHRIRRVSLEKISAPAVRLSDSSLTFGTTKVAEVSQKTVTISNTSNTSLSVTGIKVIGTDASQFTVSPATATIARGDSLAVIVTFVPSSVGPKSASLSITHNAAGIPSVISMSGVGVVPDIEVLPISLNFGEVQINQSKDSLLVITNRGTASLVVSNITSSSEAFKVSPATFTIAPKDSHTITVTFAPFTIGVRSDTLIITSDDPDEHIVKTTLNGDAVFDTVEIAGPVTLDFDTATGDQGRRIKKGVKTNSGISVQLFIKNAPAISGYSVHFEFDPVTLGNFTFTPSDFIPDKLPLPPTQRVPGTVDVGSSNLTRATRSGDGLLGIVTFQTTEKFSKKTYLVASQVVFSLPGGQQQEVKQRAIITLTNTKPTPDFTGDGRVGFDDFFKLANVFGTYDSDYDLTGDGFIDFSDFFVFADAFGKSGGSIGKLMTLAQKYIGLPAVSQLEQSFPNPFNASTMIRYQLVGAGLVKIDIFDLGGQKVKSLVNGFQEPRAYEITWDGVDESNQAVSTGMYLVRLQVGDFSSVRKMLLIK